MTRTYTAVDDCGNETSHVQTINVQDTTAPVIGVQAADETVESDGAGNSAALTAWLSSNGGATATDDCGAVTWTHDFTSLSDDCGATGSALVTFTASDDCGNTTTSSATFTIEDTTAPTANAQDLTLTLDGTGNISLTAAEVDNGSNDAPQGAVTLSIDVTSFTCAETGANSVTLTVTDECGNTSTSVATITVQDTENPTISGMPANINLTNDAGICGAVATWTAPTTDDNCSSTISGDAASGDTFPVGTTTVTYTATDASGNTATSTFDITVTDDEDPVIAGTPSDITQTADAEQCAAVVTFTAATANDNCGIATFSGSASSGDSFPVGATTVTYTATDDAGNTSTSSFTVTITDDEAPVITGTPSNIEADMDASSCDAVVSWTAPSTTDNCSTTLTSSHDSGDTFNGGVTTVTYTSTDGAGNVTTSSFTVTVSDAEDPTIAGMPTTINLNNDAGICGAVATWTAPTTDDNCSSTISGTHTSGSIFGVGTTTVTYTATDDAGNTAAETFQVIVTDTENPVIAGTPSDMTQTADAGQCGAVVTFTAPTASDNCSVVTFTDDAASGDTFPVGTTTVTYTATDASGNTATSTFDITVTDDEDPVIAGTPSDITQTADAEQCAAVVTFTAATANDNCGIATFSGSASSGDSFPVGATTVTYTATDDAGNTSTSSFTVTITDDEAPVITGTPSNIEADMDASSCDAVVSWTAPSTTDNCSTTLTSSHDSGDTFNGGVTTVTYTSTDGAGNVTTSSFTVTVSDAEDPTIAGMPTTINLNNDAGICGAVATWTAPTTDDNCSSTISGTHTSGSIFGVGTTTVTYTATDDAGNTAAETFQVIVTDTENPVIAGTPSDMTQTADAGQCGAVVTFTAPTASDNCSVVTFTDDAASGDTFPVGTTTVTYTATDASGNTATSTFDITVTDDEDPVIAGTPSDITQTADAEQCAAVVTFTAATANDNCGIATFSGSASSGDSFPVGATTVTYTATDDAGNTSTSSFTVTITDDEAPVITGTPSNIEADMDASSCDAVVSWTAPSTTDNCSTTLTSSHDSGDTFNGGVTTVTYTSTDGAGNVTTSSFTVTVSDAEDPTIAGMPTTINLNNDAGICGAVATWTAPTTDDNCSSTISGTHTSGSIFAVGTTTVTYTATDDAGNTAAETFQVIVTDNEGPSITSSDQNVTTDAGACTAVVNYSTVTSTDNCSEPTVTYSISNGSTFSLGTTAVTVTSTDEFGNVSTATFDVIVADGEAPTITAGTDETVQCDGAGNNTELLAWLGNNGGATATDNCSAVTWSNDFTTLAYTCGSTSSVNVVFTATDDAGNASTTQGTFTIEDTTAPSIDTQATNETVECDGAGNTTAFQSWLDSHGGAAASEICSSVTWSHNYLGDFGDGVTNDFSNGCGATGSITVTFTATDDCGNASETQAIFTIEDTTDPTPLAKDVTVTLDATGAATMNAQAMDNGSSDGCGTVSFGASQTSFTCDDLGDNTVTLTVTDECSNSATATATVTVVDNTDPTIDVAAQDESHECDGVSNFSTELAAWLANNGGATASDACGPLTWSYSPNPATMSPTCGGASEVIVTFTVTDVSGNSTDTQATFSIEDTTAPAILSPATDVTVECDGLGNTGDLSAWLASNGGAGLAEDDCSDITWSNNFTGLGMTCAGSGAVEVIFSATDDCGNESTTMATFTIEDTTAPSSTNNAADLTLECGDAGNAATFQAWLDDNGGARVEDDLCGSTVTWSSDYTFVINCGSTGSALVTFSATDNCGNATEFTATYTIEDTTPPVALASDFTAILDGNGQATITSADIDNGSYDNCSSVSLSLDVTAFDCDDVGANDVILTVTDDCGQTTSSTVTVTVTAADQDDPELSNVPSDITTTTDAGLCTAVVTWTNPTVADNCGNGTLTTSHDPDDAFPVGTTTVTFTANDGNGNNSSATMDITVTDDELPVIAGMPANFNLSNDAGICGAVATWTDPTATDNCGVASLTGTHASGATFAVGTTTVTYTAVDVNGNQSTASFTVTVTDNEDPAISGTPTDMTVSNDAGQCSAVVTWTAPTAADNCSVASFSGDASSGDTFNVGNTTVIYTATDIYGNTSTTSFVITVNDDEDPAIAGTPSDITQTADAGQCGAVVNYTAPTSSDNCGVTSYTSTHDSGDTFVVGTTTVTYTAVDAAGNQTTSSFTVTITDNEAPAIAGTPANITQTADAGQCGAVVNYTAPTSTDNCAVTSFTSTHDSGDTFVVGTTTVTYTAVDAAGNQTTSSFTVTVTDDEAPAIAGMPTNINISNDAGICGAVATWTDPTATDNCGVASFTGTHASGATFAVGTTTVTYTAVDVNGNQSTASFTVTVTDNEDPAISGTPTDMTVSNDAGQCSAVVTWTAPTAADNCSVASFSGDASSGDTFNVGNTTVIYTATDIYGNTSTTSFVITVNDDEDPAIAGTPSDITQTADAGQCGAVVNYTAPTSSDNCGVTSYTSTHDSGDTFVVGTTTVTYTAVDAAGNQTTSSFTVTITDNEAPAIAGTPANITQTADAGQCGAVVNYTAPTSTDNCAVTSFTSTHDSGDTFVVGTTTVTYTAVDAAGNQTTSSFTVTVTDDEAPAIAGMPTNINISNDAGICGAVATWTDPTATDNCGVASFTGTHASGATFAVGTTTVTYTAVDVNGNQSTASFTVTVTDDEAPVIASAAQDETVECDGAGNTAQFNAWLAANGNAGSASDNCTTPTWSNDYDAANFVSTCGQAGSVEVTFTATDGAANSSSSTARFTIEDTTVPYVVPEGLTVTVECDGNGNIAEYEAWHDLWESGIAVSDICSGVTYGLVSETLTDDCGATGTSTKTYTMTDGCGNSADTTLSFIIADTTPPAFNETLPADGTFECDNVPVADILTATDICSGDESVTYTEVSTPGACPDSYTITRTWSTTDDCGNNNTHVQTLTIQDTTSPSVDTAASDETVECDGAGNTAASVLG